MGRRAIGKPNDFVKKTADVSALNRGQKAGVNIEVGKGKATASQWAWIDTAVKAWMDKYPTEMVAFIQDLEVNRTKYQDVLKSHGKTELAKANWRNTAAFPTIMEWNAEANDYVEVDSLLPILKKFIPDLTDSDSKNFHEFMRRYPIFRPGQKI